MDRLFQDLRDACRRFVGERTFSAVVVLTLGLGIGANTAIFTLIKTVLLSPLPYGDADRLMMIWNITDKGGTTWLSAQEILSYRRDAASLEQVAAYMETEANLTGGQEPERVRAALVTPNLFDTLEVGALLGRTFAASEDQAGASDVVVLGHGLWQRRFGGAADIVGQSIQMNGRPRVVVGVMPPSFRLPLDYRNRRPTEAWTPLLLESPDMAGWGNRSLTGIGRLRRGVEPSTATSEFTVISERWVRAGYVRDEGDGRLARSAMPVQRLITGRVSTPLLILLGTVGFVLLIACANVVNLLLAKADIRSREIAVRAALGAGRGRLIRQLLTETMLLSIGGAAVGMAIGYGGVRLLATLRPIGLPRVEEISLDGGVLAFTVALALLTGLLVGLAPARQLSRPDLTGVLNDGGRSGTTGRRRQTVRRSLVVMQMALSVILVLAAGLLARSLIEMNRIELGFDPRNVLTARLQLPLAEYKEYASAVRFFRQLVERLEQHPGVRSAGVCRILPLTRTMGDWSITLEGRPRAPNENPNGDFQVVTPGYLTAMGFRLIRGRLLADTDRENAPLVVLVNDTMAKRYWPGDDAIGRRFYLGTGNLPWLTIVGIVQTARHNAVIEEPRAEMYLPHAQLPAAAGFATLGMTLVVKTDADLLAMVAYVRDTVRSLDPNLPMSDVRSMDRVVAEALSQPRFTTLMLVLFAALALTLAAVGTYGTISLLVTERSHEIGIRMALGAGRRGILSMVLREGLLLAGAGVAIGVICALFLTRLFQNLLYGVSAWDPATFALVPALLGVVALAASLNPARRAAAVDPAVTLRRG